MENKVTEQVQCYLFKIVYMFSTVVGATQETWKRVSIPC